MKRFQKISSALYFVCSVCIAQDGAVSPLSQSQAMLEEKSRIESLIAELESDYGPFDARLLEPLESLAELYLSAEQYSQLDAVYSRQLQLMRADKGLDHPDNIAIVRRIVENQIKQGNWSDVSDNLEHIRYLQSVNRDASPDGLIAAINEQANWLKARIYLDEARLRSRHLLDARDLFEDALDLVENHYGEGSVESVPILYHQASILFELVAFLNAEDSLSSEAIDRLILADGIARLQLAGGRGQGSFNGLLGIGYNIPIVDGDALVGESYLREALSKIDDVRDIFEAENNLEALAMANVAYGDFQILLGRGSGAKSYERAQELLFEASVNANAVAAFFASPQIIPMENLPLTLDAAISQKNSDTSNLIELDADEVFVGEFVALDESAAIVRMSQAVRRYDFAKPDALVDLKLTVNSRGNASSVKVISAEPNDGYVRRKALEAVRRMQFRPVFDGKKTRRVRDVRIRYRFDNS